MITPREFKEKYNKESMSWHAPGDVVVVNVAFKDIQELDTFFDIDSLKAMSPTELIELKKDIENVLLSHHKITDGLYEKEKQRTLMSGFDTGDFVKFSHKLKRVEIRLQFNKTGKLKQSEDIIIRLARRGSKKLIGFTKDNSKWYVPPSMCTKVKNWEGDLW